MAKILSDRKLAGSFDNVTKVTATAMKVTPKKAQQMSKGKRYPRQRPIRNVTVSKFSRALDEKYFRVGSQICIAIYKGKQFVVDGQHRLAAIAETGVAAVLTITKYYCQTMKQVHELYIFFDNGDSARTKADLFIARYGATVLKALPKKMITRMISACLVIANCYSQSIARLASGHMHHILHCSKRFMSSMVAFLKCTKAATGPLRRETLLSQAVLSVALVTMEWAPKKAKAFWDGVAHNGVKRKDDPRQALREQLIQLQTTRRNVFNHRKGVKAFTPREISHIVAWCWNHFYKDKPLAAIEVEAAASLSPIFIDGTPFRFPHDSAEFAEAVKGYGIGDTHSLHKYVRRSSTDYGKSA